MKKKILFGFVLVSLALIASLNVKAYVQLEQASEGLMAEEKARNVWCQVLGDRQGCRNDNSRSCDNTVFCE